MKEKTTLRLKGGALRNAVKVFLLFAGTTSWSQIYTNGGLSTGATSNSGVAAPTGYTWSEVQNITGNTTESNTNSGYSGFFTTSLASDFKIADNFIVPAATQWNVTGFDFYLYQTGSTGTVPPIDQLRVQIYNGDPSLGTSTVVAGNMTTNVYAAASSADALMYRTFNSLVPAPVATGTTRKIWRVRANITASLPAGTYWVVYQAHATNDGTLFFPSVTIPGSRGLAGWNGKQSSAGVWTTMFDDGNPASAPDFPQDVPFQVYGTTLAVSQNDFSATVSLYPNPVNNSFQVEMPTNSVLKSAAIYDLSGRIIKSINVSDSEIFTVNTSELAAGNYLLKLFSDSGTAVKKFSKL